MIFRIPLRTAALAMASALALAACEQQPVGSFRNAEYVVGDPQPLQTVYFNPGSPSLRSGEVSRLQTFLGGQLLTADDDILVYVGGTGSRVLDARRRGTMMHSLPRTPARVRLVAAPQSELGSDLRVDAAQVKVVHYNKIVVECPGNPAGPDELTTPLPEIGCSNAYNRATMAVEKRDLIAPRTLTGSDGVTGAAAMQRYREDKVKVIPLDSTTSGN
jgi:type IV pilus biogenesis protein CpaD/CtpE